MTGKYVCRNGGQVIIHCPFCRGVLMKCSEHGEPRAGTLVMAMRCPHCRRDVTVVRADGKFTVGETAPSLVKQVAGVLAAALLLSVLS